MARSRKKDASPESGASAKGEETKEVVPDEKPEEVADSAESRSDPEVELTEPDPVEASPQPDSPEIASVEESPEIAPAEEFPEIAPAEDRRAPPRRSGFGGLLLGGVIAAGLGAAAAVYVLPKVWTPNVDSGLNAVNEELSRQSVLIDALTKQVSQIESRPAATADDLATLEKSLSEELNGVRQGLSKSESQVSETAKTLDAMNARLATLEKRPAAGGEASQTALDAFDREMKEMRAEIETQRQEADAARSEITAAAEAVTKQLASAEAKAERLQAEAEAAARKVSARADLSRILAAMDTGVAFKASLANLQDAGIEVPAPLAEQAQGVPTLAALKQAFPPAARDALAASLKETSGESVWSRMTAFLRSQTGARSLSPRAGNDPDAVLSRAEAALGAGDVTKALEELKSLPEAGQARMAEWSKLANRRLAAQKAADELKAALE